jgi:inner membrane protein
VTSGTKRTLGSLRRAAPLLAVVTVAGLDLIRVQRSWPIPVTGALDEAAHLLTAWLVLDAFMTNRTVWPWVLLGAVAIDLDHIPLYLSDAPTLTSGGRPLTHGLLTVAGLLLMAAAVPRLRTAAGGLALGVLLHFPRDLVTGPGLPLLWPLLHENLRLPYWTYLLALAAVATAGLLRRRGAPPWTGSRPAACAEPRRGKA